MALKEVQAPTERKSAARSAPHGGATPADRAAHDDPARRLVGAAAAHRLCPGGLRRVSPPGGHSRTPITEVGPYLSPFYSPEIVTKWTVLGRHFSPALFILPFPLFFRATCYYYRKAYYRAFFWDPPACAVGEIAPRKNYTGERAFPFVLQNLHRYAFYFAVVILVILWWDALLAFDFRAGRASAWA